MKKIILGLIVVSLYACGSQEAKTTSNDDAVLADFNENSKVALSLFHAFENKDMSVFEKNLADSAKIIGAKYGDSVFTKAQNIAILSNLTKLFVVSKANDIMLYPACDSVTYKMNSDVRAYVRWTDDAVNGAKIEHKYYVVFQFNKDHEVTLIDEYFDVTGMLNASTAPKK
jgi:hypothetical protein